MRDLTGETTLVTDATSGIGRATVLALAAAGATVAVSGRNKEKGQAVVGEARIGAADQVQLLAQVGG
jgi:NAD(P)-dependent dehydrogenase (short-subunit alcohol dehydrogenase family)